MASSRMREAARRRELRSPRLARVMYLSITRFKSFALAKVVTICSWRIKAAAILENMAWRWPLSRLKRRPSLRCRIIQVLCVVGSEVLWPRVVRGKPVTHALIGARRPSPSILILEALGQVLDIVGRPIRHLHAEVQTHAGQHLLDLVERLAPEVWRAQHLRFGLLDEVAD